MSLTWTAQQIIDFARNLCEDTDKPHSTLQDSGTPSYLDLVNDVGGIVYQELNVGIFDQSSIVFNSGDKSSQLNTASTTAVADRFVRAEGYVTASGATTTKPLERCAMHDILDLQDNVATSSTPTMWAVERIDGSVSTWTFRLYPIPSAGFTFVPHSVNRMNDLSDVTVSYALPINEARLVARLVAAEAARINGRGGEQGFIDRILAPVPERFKLLFGWPGRMTDAPESHPSPEPV